MAHEADRPGPDPDEPRGPAGEGGRGGSGGGADSGGSAGSGGPGASGAPGETPEAAGVGGLGGVVRELRDAVTPRSALVVLGVLLLQLGFALSYMGAFHAPKPHRVPVVVAAPPSALGTAVARLNALPGEPVHATAVSGEAQARQRLLERRTDAAFLLDPRAKADTLLVASAAGSSASDAATRVVRTVNTAQHRDVVVRDIRPPAAGDFRGLSSFYLVLSWTIGGYLASSALSMAAGSRRPTLRRVLVRLLVMLPYAFVSGVGGAVIVGPVLNCLPGAFWELAGIGTLVVYASAAAGVALQSLAGTVGLGLTILIFTVLGNPSSGGVYPGPLLPPFWRAIGQALPPGAGTTAVRNTVYFDGHDIATAIWVLVAWAVGGSLVAIASSAVRGLRTRRALVARPAL